MNKVLTIMILTCLSMSCIITEKKDDKKTKKEDDTPMVYEVFPVPQQLTEISGITFVNDSLVAAIEDESGIIYFYDLVKQEVTRELSFAKDDDYEDLVMVNNDIYVVVANGTIFKIADFRTTTPTISKFKTELTEENNIESLAYDAANQTLLLIVKDKNLVKDNQQKDVYSFSLATQKLNTKAAYSIKLKDIEAKFKGDAIEETSKKFLKIIGNENLNDIIRPSAMSVHPITGDLYVLSAINQIIVVLSKENILKSVITFKGKDFIQPEGIAFNSKGELFISNEGKNKQANIIKLNQIEAK